MKKQYKKPWIYVESFVLLEHIAAGCTYQEGSATMQTKDSCSYSDANITLFVNTGVNGCLNQNYAYEIDGPFENYLNNLLGNTECYNAFGNGKFFGS